MKEGENNWEQQEARESTNVELREHSRSNTCNKNTFVEDRSTNNKVLNQEVEVNLHGKTEEELSDSCGINNGAGVEGVLDRLFEVIESSEEEEEKEEEEEIVNIGFDRFLQDLLDEVEPANKREYVGQPIVEVRIFDENVKCLIDTGSEVCAVSQNFVNEIPANKQVVRMPHTSKLMEGYNGYGGSEEVDPSELDSVRAVNNLIEFETLKMIKSNRERLIPVVKTITLCGRENIPLRGHLDDGQEIQQHKMESNSNKQDENITRSVPELGTIDTVVGLENPIDESTPTKQEEREVKPKVVKSEPNVSVDASHKGEDMELTSLLNSMMAQIREGNASLKAEMASHISQLDENLSGKIKANLDILNTQSQRITERKVTEIEKRFDTEIQKIEKSVEPLVSEKLEPIIESKLQVIVPVVKKEIVKETAADIETLRNTMLSFDACVQEQENTLRNEIKLLSQQVQNQTFLNCSGIPLYNAGIQTEEREQGGIFTGNEVGKEYRSDVKAHVNEISTIRGQSDELMKEESEKALFVGRDGNRAERQGQGRSDVIYGKRFVRIVDESHREVIKEERVGKKKGHSAETHADSEITSSAEYVHQLKSQPAQLERSSTQVINLDPNMTVLESHTDYDVYLVTARVHDCDEDSFKEIRESVSNQEKECCDPCSTEANELSETGIPLVGENNESKSGECTIQQRESREMDYNLQELFESEEGHISKEEELSSESSESIQGEKEVEEVSDSATESSGMTDSNENEMALKSLDEGLLEKVVKEFRMKRRKKPPDGMERLLIELSLLDTSIRIGACVTELK
ncbi:probable GPI-anchored adhesin-like protein PGA55 [Schistocerca americana]|uniref:probable GPI-anchored adhesin-like protein PGA55 n=1 Tax=Schistocerca americana TaxID=7009 RepID=UPI001F4FBBB5|nr:probable GPI-anchored adhesin-like protein PGA55 [Schistocerca americana]